MTISVVIATYNGEQFLREQMDSVLAQTLMPDEIIVSDDGSTDGTWAILEEYQKRYPKLFRLYKNEGEHGAHANFRYAFQFVTCDLVAPCDQDDIWMPEKLERSVSQIGDNVSFVFCQEQIRYEDGKTMLLSHAMPPLHKNLFGNMIAGHLIVCKRELLDVFKVAPIAFDWGLTLYAAADMSGKAIDYEGCVWRRHENVVTSAYSDHNPLQFKTYSKWKKLRHTLWLITKGVNSAVIADRMHSVNAILVWMRKERVAYKSKQYYEIGLCSRAVSCIEKQTLLTMLRACCTYSRIIRRQEDYHNASWRQKIGMNLYAFCYPAVWWYDYHDYDSL